MKKRNRKKIAHALAGSALLFVGSARAAGFSSTVIGLKHAGKVTISNDGSSITAYQAIGDFRNALFSLRSSRTLHTNSFGSSVYDTQARAHRRLTPEMSSLFNEAAAKAGIDPRLIVAVAGRESRYNPKAVSPVGACGLMQLMPTTAKWLGVDDVFDARQNVFAGARYLRTLLDTFHGDLDLTLAAYNAGPGAVAKHNGVPPFHETQQYVAVVRANYEKLLLD